MMTSYFEGWSMQTIQTVFVTTHELERSTENALDFNRFFVNNMLYICDKTCEYFNNLCILLKRGLKPEWSRSRVRELTTLVKSKVK